MTQIPPPPAPPGGQYLRPHRGVIILVLGILGILVCVICGIVAWVMANGDLRQMDSGLMDPEGRQLTQVGKILGIVSVVLTCIGLALSLVWIVFVLMFGLAAAAGSGP